MSECAPHTGIEDADPAPLRAQASRAGRDLARRALLRDADPELLLEPDLPLRPDPLAEPRRHDDRPVPGEHGRQGLLQGPLLLRPRARAGAVLAAVLRRAEPRRTPNRGRTRTWRRPTTRATR